MFAIGQVYTNRSHRQRYLVVCSNDDGTVTLAYRSRTDRTISLIEESLSTFEEAILDGTLVLVESVI